MTRVCLTSTVSSKSIFRSFSSKIYPIGVCGDDRDTSKHVTDDEGRPCQEIHTFSLATNRAPTAGPGTNFGNSGLNDKDVEVRQNDVVSGGQEMAAVSLGGDRTLDADIETNLGGSGPIIQTGKSRPNDEDSEMDVEEEQQDDGDREKEAEEQVGKSDGFGESDGPNRENWGGGGEGIQVRVCGPNDGHVGEEQAAIGDVENREQIGKDRGKKSKERVEKGGDPELQTGRRYPKRETKEKVVAPPKPSFAPKPRKAAPPKYTTKLRAPRATTWPRDGDIFGQPIDLSVSVPFSISCISDTLFESWMTPQRSTTLPPQRLVEVF